VTRTAPTARPRGFGALSGPWHAHVGWRFNSVGQAERRRYAADLLKDRGMRRIDAAEKPLILVSLAIPFLLVRAFGELPPSGL